MNFFLKFDLVYVVIPCILTLLAVVANIICTYIFASRHFDGKIYRYIAMNSVVDCALVLIFVPLPFINSTLAPQWRPKSYYVCIYRLIVMYYLARVLGFLSSLVNLKISIDRLLFMKRNNLIYDSEQGKKFALIAVIMTFASFLVFTPRLFLMRVAAVTNNATLVNYSDLANTNDYEVILSNHTEFNKIYNSLSMHLTTTPVFIAMLLTNISLGCYLNKKLDMKPNMCECEAFNARPIAVRREITHRKIIVLVIWIASINLIDMIVNIAVNVIFTFYGNGSIYDCKPALFAIHLAVIFCHGINIFVYYKCNKQFASCVKRLLRFQFS
jgi:hypothetical protein